MSDRRKKPSLAVQILDALDALEADPQRQALWATLCELGRCWSCQEPFGRHTPQCEVWEWTR
jgi:hypothetical protein